MTTNGPPPGHPPSTPYPQNPPPRGSVPSVPASDSLAGAYGPQTSPPAYPPQPGYPPPQGYPPPYPPAAHGYQPPPGYVPPPPGYAPPPYGYQPPPPGFPPPPYGYPPGPPPYGAPPPGFPGFVCRFLGSEGAFFGLLVRGSILLALTLGIYRFWLTTDIRRFLWGNTEIAGDALEYTGTARELLIGFLIAIVLLLPINGLIFLGTMAPALLPYSGTVGFVLLALLGQFAYFRARRYRLTRTVYRGIRFFQTGSGWNYSVRSNLWSVLILLTAGLAYPWAAASLERYKMRHTYFGNLEGRFEGSGTRLFVRGLLLWIVVVAPLLIGLVAAALTIDWAVVVTAITASTGGDIFDRLEESSPAFVAALGGLVAALVWSTTAGTLLYPVFKAIVTRWWISGIRLGGVSVTSHLRNGQMYMIYLRFFGFSILYSLGASAVFGVAAGLFYSLIKPFDASSVIEILSVVLALVAYVVMMLGYSALYQGLVTIRVWRLGFEMTELTGLEALANVQARGGPGSAIGEGLADALDVGGL